MIEHNTYVLVGGGSLLALCVLKSLVAWGVISPGLVSKEVNRACGAAVDPNASGAQFGSEMNQTCLGREPSYAATALDWSQMPAVNSAFNCGPARSNILSDNLIDPIGILLGLKPVVS